MYQNLLENRKNFRNGKARGFEWKPVKMAKAPLERTDNGIPETIERCLAIALHLELPAGEWAAQSSTAELPPYAKELLLSNAADETIHYKAFSYAAEDYLEDKKNLVRSELIAQAWNENESHPIEKVALAETGIFLPSLAFLRVFGGATLNHVAANVSRDEQRHVQTNRAILDDLAIAHYNPSSQLEELRRDTLDWIFAPLNYFWDKRLDCGFSSDFWMAQSIELIRDGRSPILERLTQGSDDFSPFELPNAVLY